MKLLREPLVMGILAMGAGAATGVAGVFVLAGTGWALLAAAGVLACAGAVLVRGGAAEQEAPRG